jgi:hypothetical protein
MIKYFNFKSLLAITKIYPEKYWKSESCIPSRLIPILPRMLFVGFFSFHLKSRVFQQPSAQNQTNKTRQSQTFVNLVTLVPVSFKLAGVLWRGLVDGILSGQGVKGDAGRPSSVPDSFFYPWSSHSNSEPR